VRYGVAFSNGLRVSAAPKPDRWRLIHSVFRKNLLGSFESLVDCIGRLHAVFDDIGMRLSGGVKPRVVPSTEHRLMLLMAVLLSLFGRVPSTRALLISVATFADDTLRQKTFERAGPLLAITQN
jgi:hypothetical protein